MYQIRRDGKNLFIGKPYPIKIYLDSSFEVINHFDVIELKTMGGSVDLSKDYIYIHITIL